MKEGQYTVFDQEQGEIEIALQHPSNRFQMPVEVARSLALEILRNTGGSKD